MVFKALRLIQRRLLFCHCHTAVYGQQLGAYRLHQFSISIAYILLGFGDNTYGPTKPVTREQLAAILYRYAQFKEYPTSIPSTTDLGREDVSPWAIKAYSQILIVKDCEYDLKVIGGILVMEIRTGLDCHGPRFL